MAVQRSDANNDDLTPAEHRCVRDAVEAAIACPTAERDIALSSLADAPHLLKAARDLIAAHGRLETSFLSTADSDDSIMQQVLAGNPIGSCVGPYRLLQLLGRGGMGAVYLAVREDGGHELVALKILEIDSDDIGARQRFKQEQRLLATMEHPAIPRLIDSGTAHNRPYLVMEYVQGTPIDEHCEQQRLTIDDRLELFAATCDAVQCAHQHLVVHRDLKPANILITPDGAPKLLDFGIGKLLPEGGDRQHTATMGGPMTLAYASPEQIRAQPVTVAADIHALGVILFQLLTGAHPFELEGLAPYEQQQVICEREPLLPSVVAADHALRRRIRGDLDTIVCRAMAKDPRRRYASVQDLSADVRRHLHGLPVMARKDTPMYRMWKFIRRHRTAVSAGVLIVVMGLAAIIGSASAALRARHAERTAGQQQREAERARSDADQVAAFLGKLMASANPYHYGNDPTVLELLADAESLIESELANEPRVEAEVRLSLGRTFVGLWRWRAATDHLRRSLALRRANDRRDDEGLADTLLLLSRSLAHVGDPSSVEIAREGLRIRERLFVADDPAVAEAQHVLAYARWQDGTPEAAEESESLYRAALAGYDSMANRRTPEWALALYSFSDFLLNHRRFEEGAEFAVRAVAMYEALGRPADRYHAECLRGLATVLEDSGRIEEAETAVLEYLAMTPVTVHDVRANRAIWQLGRLRLWQDDANGAAEHFHRALRADLHAFRASCPSREDEVDALLAAMNEPGVSLPYDRCFEFLHSFTMRKDIVVGQFLPVAEWLMQEGRPEDARPLLHACRQALASFDEPSFMQRIERALDEVNDRRRWRRTIGLATVVAGGILVSER